MSKKEVERSFIDNFFEIMAETSSKGKSFKDNLNEIHHYRKEQWEDLKVHDFMDEGADAVGKYIQKPFVAVEVVFYNSVLKAIIDTYFPKTKSKIKGILKKPF